MARRSERRRGVRLVVLGVVGGLAVVVIATIWTRVTASPAYCASCHEMDAAVETAATSVHADVPCLACHERPGTAGAVLYVPTLAREVLHRFVFDDMATGVLRAAPCTRCHEEVLAGAGAELAAHPGADAACDSCHGNVAHPRARASPDDPHPARYTELHGRDVVAAAEVLRDPTLATEDTCTTCHDPRTFCETCHFRAGYPHEDGWVRAHGTAVESATPGACTLCHAPETFCASCHGTEIPHRPTWLADHPAEVTETADQTCLVCHAPTDCTTCHTRHRTHDGTVAAAPPSTLPRGDP